MIEVKQPVGKDTYIGYSLCLQTREGDTRQSIEVNSTRLDKNNSSSFLEGRIELSENGYYQFLRPESKYGETPVTINMGAENPIIMSKEQFAVIALTGATEYLRRLQEDREQRQHNPLLRAEEYLRLIAGLPPRGLPR